MGIRLHAVSRKRCYGYNSLFNNKIEQINRLFINEFGAYPEGEEWEYAKTICIEADKFQRVIEAIKKDEDDIRNRISLYINVDFFEFADELQELYNEADNSDNEIQLCWF